LAIAAGVVTELWFSAPIALSTTERYRITYYDASNDSFYQQFIGDHPDGAVTILTYWSRANATSTVAGNSYPNAQYSTASWAGEPIIYAYPAALPDARPTVTAQLDNFTGTGALTAHSPDVGGPWTVLQGQFGELSSGKLTYQNAAGGEDGVALVNGGTGNCEVISSLSGAAQKGGVVVRSTSDGTSRFLVVPLTSLSTIILLQYTALSVASSISTLTGVVWATNDYHAMTVLCRENIIRVLVDGTFVGESLLVQSLAEQGYHGVGTSGRAYTATEIGWESFQVQSLTGWKDILIFGDSFTNHVGLITDQSKWPLMLTRQYNGAKSWPLNYAVAASHITGDADSTGLAGQIDLAANEDPDYIIIMLGTNDDGVAGTGVIQPAYEAGLTTLKARHPGVPIYCCSIPPRTAGSAPAKVQNDLDIAAAVAAQGCTLWDTSTWLNTATDLEGDGLHPNAAGQAKIAAAMLALLP
jgi:lysophospholipase L1-like esterase